MNHPWKYLAAFALALPAAFANVTYSFSGVGADGRTVTFQHTAAAPLGASAVLTAAQLACAPACDDVAVFNNAQLGYDLLIFDLHNTSGPPTPYAFYFPSGAFANPGAYTTIPVAGAQNSGSLSVQQSGAPGINAPSLLPHGVVGAAYNASFSSSGGVSPYSYSVDSSTPLPPGLTLSPAGVLGGTPSTPGDYPLLVRVTDSLSASSTRSYSLSIAAGLQITTPAALPGSAGAPYSLALTAAGGTPPYTWTVSSGALPPGLSLSPAGTLSGVPTAGGSFTFTAKVADFSAATASRVFTISVASIVTITTPPTLPNAAAGAALNLPLAAVGGTSPYTWTLTAGALPAGVSLNPSGALTGTPTTASNTIFTLQAADQAGATASRSFTWFIQSGLTISDNSPLPAATVGSPYSFTFTPAGGVAPYSWSVTSGSAPPGLSLSPSGVLSGTPSAPGLSTFFLKLTDNASGTALGAFNLQVLPAVSITSPAILPPGNPGTPYNQTLAATGGASPYSWILVSGSLPPGLALSTSGALSGVPTTGGTYNFAVRATETGGGFSLRSFNLSVSAALVISTAAQLPNASIGVQYAQTFSASGGSTPYLWTIAGGAVPPGLSLSTTGVLAGTPLNAGTYTFDVRVTDAASVSVTQTFSLIVGAGLSIASPPTLPAGVPGVAYNQTLQAAGGTPPYTWAVVSGTLPPGLLLSQAGVISGTPTTAGGYSFQARVTDSAAATATQTFNISIGNNLTITSAGTLPVAVVAQPYSFTFNAAAGTPPYTWSIAGGSVPPGLTLAPNGVLSGTPSAQGAFFFTVRVTDSVTTSVIQNFSLTVNTGIAITTASALPAASVGIPYNQALTAAGGAPPYSWSLYSGSLPPGLLLGASGAISGTPSAAGSYTFTIRVTDSSAASATAPFTLTVGGGLTITTAALPSAAIGVPYSQTLAVAGGAAPYVWSLQAGSMPPGLSLAPNGVLSGTPSLLGQFSFTVRVSDAASLTADKTFQINVNPAVTILSASPLPNGAFGAPYFQTLQASGGLPPFSWTVSSGSLPPGLNLAGSGTLIGTPTLGGTFNFTAQVTDSAGTAAAKPFALTITTAVAITTAPTLPAGTVGVSYFLTFGASGGAGPYSWSLLAGALPPGLTLSPSGTLSGTPAAPGAFQFTLRLADSAQVATQASFSLTIGSGDSLPRSGIIAQIASGGTWKTTITLLNPTASPAQVRVAFYGDDGSFLSLPLVVTQGSAAVSVVASSVERTIPPNGTLLLESEAASSLAAVGWADVRSSTPVSGFAIFRQKHGSGVDSEGTSPLQSLFAPSFLQPMDNQIGFSTGVALVNLAADQEAVLTAIVYDENGAEIARENFTLPPNGHTSFSVPAKYPALAGKRGFIEFQTNRAPGITGLGLRFQPTLSFTSVPIILR